MAGVAVGTCLDYGLTNSYQKLGSTIKSKTRKAGVFPADHLAEGSHWITWGKNSFASFMKSDYRKRGVTRHTSQWSLKDNLFLCGPFCWLLWSKFYCLGALTPSPLISQGISLEAFCYSNCPSLFREITNYPRRWELNPCSFGEIQDY